MKIAYLPLSTTIASVRLRGAIPARALSAMGFEPVTHDTKADWIVLQKHGWPEEMATGHKRTLFDVCDDHFHDQHSEHYRKWCAKADKITCNSQVMADIIKAETGRDAAVIPDPYEGEELPPKVGRPLLWFGHRSNLPDLMPWIHRLGPLVVVSNHPADWVTQWSPEALREAFRQTGMTVIPTGKSQAKSANRAIEAIRAGHFPVCGRLPAYEELGLGCDDISLGVERAQNDPRTRERIRQLQSIVRERFSPMVIGELWANCFST